jgi:transposase
LNNDEQRVLMTAIFGVAGVDDTIEIYAVNNARENTLHGWFQEYSGFLVLSNHPPCMIAIDYETLSDEIIAGLRDKGHAVVVMPPRPIPCTKRSGRTAKEVCQLAVGLAEAYRAHTPLH